MKKNKKELVNENLNEEILDQVGGGRIICSHGPACDFRGRPIENGGKCSYIVKDDKTNQVLKSFRGLNAMNEAIKYAKENGLSTKIEHGYSIS